MVNGSSLMLPAPTGAKLEPAISGHVRACAGGEQGEAHEQEGLGRWPWGWGQGQGQAGQGCIRASVMLESWTDQQDLCLDKVGR